MVRTVEDAALTMNVISGFDPKDVASARVNIPDYTENLNKSIQGLRVGIVKEFFDAPLDAEVESIVRKAISHIESMGAEIHEVSMSMFEQSQAISGTILMCEAAAYHRELLKDHAEELYAPVRLRLESGLLITAADYLKAQQARALFNTSVNALYQTVDVLVGPSQPITAPTLLAQSVEINGTRVGTTAAVTQYLSLIHI